MIEAEAAKAGSEASEAGSEASEAGSERTTSNRLVTSCDCRHMYTHQVSIGPLGISYYGLYGLASDSSNVFKRAYQVTLFPQREGDFYVPRILHKRIVLTEF